MCCRRCTWKGKKADEYWPRCVYEIQKKLWGQPAGCWGSSTGLAGRSQSCCVMGSTWARAGSTQTCAAAVNNVKQSAIFEMEAYTQKNTMIHNRDCSRILTMMRRCTCPATGIGCSSCWMCAVICGDVVCTGGVRGAGVRSAVGGAVKSFSA